MKTINTGSPEQGPHVNIVACDFKLTPKECLQAVLFFENDLFPDCGPLAVDSLTFGLRRGLFFPLEFHASLYVKAQFNTSSFDFT